MTTETNKEIVNRYVEAVNRHDIEAAAAFVREDLQNHGAIAEAQGREGLKRILGKLIRAMPDLQVTGEDVIAEGDRVVCRMRLRGTQTGPLEMTRFPLPATGREVSTDQIHIFRMEGGLVVEHWVGRDDFGMMRQLGHLVAPATAS